MTTNFKIAVIGTSCSGKSTLAKSLASKLNIPYIEQDEVFWLPNWEHIPREVFAQKIDEMTNGPQWTICGNYSASQERIWEKVTHVIWLNYPLPVILWRALKRNSNRVIFREKCCNGNTENFRHAFLSKNSIFYWILTTHKQRVLRFNEAKRAGKFEGKVFLEFTRPKQTDEWASRFF